MKKIRFTITQELELPDECSIVEAAGGKIIQCGSLYFKPEMEYMQSDRFSKKEMRFVELDEETTDMIYGALILEKEDISEVWASI